MAEHPGHERTDADAGPLAKVGIAMAVLVAGSFIGVIILFKALAYYQPLLHDEPHPLSDTRTATPEPHIQVDPPKEKLELAKIEKTVLTTYDWVDREQRLVRIPIERAMDILATRGLPEKSGSGAAEPEGAK